MGLKDKRKAAARATAARLSAKAQPENLVPNEVNVAEPNAAITIMVEDSDGYEDGVTSQNSDLTQRVSRSWKETNLKVEVNLSELRADLHDLIAPTAGTKYEQIMQPKLVKDWKKAEHAHWAQWVPGHSDVDGNGEVDKHAKMAAESGQNNSPLTELPRFLRTDSLYCRRRP
ncbi:hypothetical protein M405DRAFT_865388 [Rhizopogon salebrosus TDB-379]|nr:hypothetical protein M405DRAFT_865388 [Rhizopogon salebrosus TDB-379]